MSTLPEVTSTADPATPDEVPVPSRRSARSYLRYVPFGLLVALAILGPILAPMSATMVTGSPSQPPSAEHLFGTDSNGFDVFSRTLTAFRLDVLIGAAVTAMATVVALVIGTVAGMYASEGGLRGRVASLAGRLIDLIQALPVMIAGLVIVSFFGRSAVVMSIALAVVLMPFQARILRSEVMRHRVDGYVIAARMSGESEFTVLRRHVLPNSWGPVMANCSAIFGMAIIMSAGLGFVGVGIPLPQAEWGNMLSSAAPDAAVGRWWAALFPALALAFSVWAASTLTAKPRPRRK